MTRPDHLPPNDRDGTAIDWDSESLDLPLLDLEAKVLMGIGIGGYVAMIGLAVALHFGWLP